MLARLAVRGGGEAVLRAAAVAGEAHGAIQAEAGQGVAFVLAELLLLRRCDELEHVRHLDVAEQVVGLDIVVAGVEIAVVLEREL